MGMPGPISKSSLDDKSVSLFNHWKEDSGIVYKEIPKNNPRPDNYKILDYIEIQEYLVIKIQYLDCINYEGIKILLFKCKLNDLKKQKLIDPHFSNNKKFISPIARFEPTIDGYRNAIKYVRLLNRLK